MMKTPIVTIVPWIGADDDLGLEVVGEVVDEDVDGRLDVGPPRDRDVVLDRRATCAADR